MVSVTTTDSKYFFLRFERIPVHFFSFSIDTTRKDNFFPPALLELVKKKGENKKGAAKILF